ncbi:hypothetical protein PRIPAC_91813 [Pristionchus pacificus]|uniref:Uncharacterized protein n=1 Tax=Pristionchus pacificus TaxID=54126 RepID=A0A2A6CD52_PRIPA|nr:hypothetical protein PRIPAC_91813 [Pristionchus pacificus]|eukprot:PDM76047.1 hypothetical protein PRIPAC_39651 [Pristionchus pacificus]
MGRSRAATGKTTYGLHESLSGSLDLISFDHQKDYPSDREIRLRNTPECPTLSSDEKQGRLPAE